MRPLVMLGVISLVNSFNGCVWWRRLSRLSVQGWEDSISEFDFEKVDVTKTDKTSQFTEEGASLAKHFPLNARVKIVSDNLKAFQVNRKSRGCFDLDTKKFIPAQDVNVQKYLLLPVGLEGTITRIYDLDELGANFPVVVRFDVWKEGEEGFKLPSKFVMHFAEDEVELAD